MRVLADCKEELPEVNLELMLDSGAFSAWTRAQSISVYDYIEFIKYYGHLFNSVVSLDVIPGEYGKRKTQKDIQTALEQSYENHLIMKDAGLKPIPIFHQYEDMSYLERMIEDGEDYIGISPTGDNISMNLRWFENVFNVITDSDGYPIVKTHGFGVTSIPIMLRFPWYSADSLSWVMQSGFGCVLVPPEGEDGKPDYTKNPISVSVTGAAAKAVRFEFQHMNKTVYDYVYSYFVDTLKTTPMEMRYNGYVRMRAMAHYFQSISDLLQYAPYKASVPSLTDSKIKGNAVKWTQKNIIFAVGLTNNVKRSLVLNKLGLNKRLLSYFDIRDYKEDSLYKYARDGITKEVASRVSKVDWGSTVYLNRKRLALSERVTALNSEGV